MPKRTPGQGRSDVTGCLNMWKESSRGIPQVVFGTRIDGMALIYPSIIPFHPPTSAKPQQVDRRVRQSGSGVRVSVTSDLLKPMRMSDPASMIAVCAASV